MRYLLLFVMATLLAMPANAAELLIIQSHRSQQLDQTVGQIRNSCGTKSQTYVMGDYAEFDLSRIVREEQPRVVIAVGDRPLKEAQKLRNTPVIYAMALSADENSLRDNIAGVSMHASPEHYLKLLQKLGLRRAGIVYSQKKSGAYIERARKSAAGFGIELVTAPVKSPREVAAALAGLTGRQIDSLWMIPDTAAVTAETLDAYFRLAQSANIPLISFSKAYLEKGALAAIEASRAKLTSQLCGKVTQLLRGTDPADIAVDDIDEASLQINEFVARKLNVSLSGPGRLSPSNSE